MSGQDFICLLPLLLPAAAAVLIMLEISVYRSHAAACILTLAGIGAAAASLPLAAAYGPRQVTSLLVIDGFALFYIGIILAATFIVAILSYAYLRRVPGQREELYLLLLLAAVGAGVMVASSHFASLFLGLELLSSCLFALIAYPRGRDNIEAVFKYLVLASVSTSFLLFGMALVYAQLGTMEFARLAAAGANGGIIYQAGLGLLIIGLGFKLALVPFHMWTPDVYQGAPAPVTAFVATVSKVGVFGLLLRFFGQVGLLGHAHLFFLLTLIAIASMFAGNLLALRQKNVKRLLAYSSISHLGYLLVAFLAGGPLGTTAATFYLVAYSVTILGAFGIVGTIPAPGEAAGGREADAIDDYRGLFWRRPWLAGVFAATLFSLAGIPLTAGFIGKFYLLDAGAGSSLWLLTLSLVASSGIGLYYYLRLITIMYLRPESGAGEEAGRPAAYPWAASLVLAALLMAIIWLGVYPAPLIDAIRRTVTLP